MYQLFRDFSKKEVDKKAFPEKFLTRSRVEPFMTLSGQQVIEALTEDSKTLSKTDTKIEIDVRVPTSEEGASFYFNAVESAEELTL
ncbi:hypothetical protein [Bacillus safensis]|uniref:hypothetical protein n=1 Tax=Bacillus safensis TaxID=561879 RepID=UPI002E1CA469|nr:hypothetical protein [Bacillus safensis]